MKRGLCVASVVSALVLATAHCADFSAADEPPTGPPDAAEDVAVVDGSVPADANDGGGLDAPLGADVAEAGGPLLPGCKALQTSSKAAKYCADFDEPGDAYRLWAGKDALPNGLMRKNGAEANFVVTPLLSPTPPNGLRINALDNGAAIGWVQIDTSALSPPYAIRFTTKVLSTVDVDLVRLEYANGNAVILRSRMSSLDILVYLNDGLSKICTLGNGFVVNDGLHDVQLSVEKTDELEVTVDNKGAKCDQTGAFSAAQEPVRMRFGMNATTLGNAGVVFDRIVVD